jgi:hypothetical protein
VDASELLTLKHVLSDYAEHYSEEDKRLMEQLKATPLTVNIGDTLRLANKVGFMTYHLQAAAELAGVIAGGGK